jgi:hypothetical protein
MMSSIREKDTQKRVIRTLSIIIIIGCLIGIIVAFTSLAILQRRVGENQEILLIWGSFRLNFTIDTVLICMNLSLLLGLLVGYWRDYKNTQSPFLLGLLIFLLVLFFQSLMSLPLLNLLLSLISSETPRQGFVYILLAYKSAIFNIIAHFFGTISLVILYYLSRE